MNDKQSPKSQIRWKSHFVLSLSLAVMIFAVGIYHSFSGRPLSWHEPLIAFGSVFFVLCIADAGRSWRMPPPYIALSAMVLYKLGTILLAFDWREAENAWRAVRDASTTLGIGLLLFGLLFGYRSLLAFLAKTLPAREPAAP